MNSTVLSGTELLPSFLPQSHQPAASAPADRLRQLTDPDFCELFQSAMRHPDRIYAQHPGLTQALLRAEARQRHITILRNKRRTLLPRYITAVSSIALFGLISLNGISGL